MIGVRDSDYAAFAWYPRLPGLDRWLALYQAAARANGGEPDAGRHLLAWAHAAGLQEVVATSTTWCFATPETRAWWGGMWADRITGSALAEQLLGEGRADQHGSRGDRRVLAGLGGRPRRVDLHPARRAGGQDALTRRSSSRTRRVRMSSRAARIGAERPLNVSVSRA